MASCDSVAPEIKPCFLGSAAARLGSGSDSANMKLRKMHDYTPEFAKFFVSNFDSVKINKLGIASSVMNFPGALLGSCAAGLRLACAYVLGMREPPLPGARAAAPALVSGSALGGALAWLIRLYPE